MREEQILRRLEELAEQRAVMERQFPAHWHRWQWSDDPEYERICFEMLNLKASLGRPFGNNGRKGGRK